MPLYSYRCLECGEEFEKLVSYSQSQQMDCPKCGSDRTQKLISHFATLGGNSVASSSGSCSSGGGFFT